MGLHWVVSDHLGTQPALQLQVLAGVDPKRLTGGTQGHSRQDWAVSGTT